MDLRRVTKFQSQQCSLPQQQNHRVGASLPLLSTQESHVYTAKSQGTPRTNVGIQKERREDLKPNDGQSTKRVRTQNARLVAKQTNRRNGDEKEPEPTSSLKTSH